ncbi:MAG: 30S ribosomal protein S6e [Candidatus Heimdallarchaeota archaeon]|nr:30S ribosomal protein S6e [Candidatus Heimdallarchaeota archaeon]
MSEKMVLNIGQDDGKTAKIILEGEARSPLYGYNIGNEVSGDVIDEDFKDYTFKITGGSDADGVAMRLDIEGTGRVRPLLGNSVGHRQQKRGIRIRKLVRGAEIFDDIAQLNLKVVKKGKKPLTES